MCSFLNITWHYSAAVHEAFGNAYIDKDVPSGNKISGSYFKLRTALVDSTLRNVEEKLARSPWETSRRLSQQTRLFLTSVHRIILWPYQFQSVNQLQQWDRITRIQNFRSFRRFVPESVHMLDKLFFPEKAWSTFVVTETAETVNCGVLEVLFENNHTFCS